MEKVLKETKWYRLYQITEPFKDYNPYIFVQLGVKYCPNCNHAYAMRFTKVFKCECGFIYKIKTPFLTKIRNLIKM